jgi:hypothetical protein
MSESSRVSPRVMMSADERDLPRKERYGFIPEQKNSSPPV